ncbi:MAG: thiamine phosphate synthase [Thalassobius sp.]|nr:thiamine phosphate synthase [Thalassovita sp.]
MHWSPESLHLYLVTDDRFPKNRDFLSVIEQAVKGGVTMVQLREKKASNRDFIERAFALKALLQPLKIPLIINDKLEVARVVDADGIHVGQDDLPTDIAREVLGENKIIGLSVENLEQAKKANNLPIDYIGLSPVFSTNTKDDIASPLGLDGVKELMKISKFPSVAIGGIKPENARSVLTAGANGLAVVSYIMGAEEPATAASEFTTIINEHLKK